MEYSDFGIARSISDAQGMLHGDVETTMRLPATSECWGHALQGRDMSQQNTVHGHKQKKYTHSHTY